MGILAFWRALAKVPRLERHAHRIDWLGVVLSSVAMFLIVFGIQEGNTYDWGMIAGGVGVWHLLAAGLAVMVLFVLWQHYTRDEPLIPLRLFHDPNFSLANIAITGMGLTVVSMSFPIVRYLQSVRGLTPTLSALIAALMEARIAAESTAAVVQYAQDLGVSPDTLAARGAESTLGHAAPAFLQGAFSSALGQSLLLPGLACIFFRKPPV